jgi:ligand-binding SRPBCC domain-containing protein
MERIEQRIVIAAPIEQVFHFHDDTRNLLRITPPSIKVAIETMGEPGLGYEVVL